MIYIPDLHTALCHVPRTSGMSISLAIFGEYPDAEAIWEGETIHGPSIHSTTDYIRTRYPNVRIFAVMRNPWRIWQSHYGWMQRYENETRPFRETLYWLIDAQWPCLRGGFFETYLDEDVDLFFYEDKPYDAIKEYLDAPGLVFEKENETIHPTPVWTDDMIAAIADWCKGDIERFGYEFCETRANT